MDMKLWKDQVFTPWLTEMEQNSQITKMQQASLKEHKDLLIKVITLLLDQKQADAIRLWNSVGVLPFLEQAVYSPVTREFTLRFKNQEPQKIMQTVLFDELNTL